jgi:predicted lysophospholipase L1 biosynthesis ABC-type transport system permease subunit
MLSGIILIVIKRLNLGFKKKVLTLLLAIDIMVLFIIGYVSGNLITAVLETTLPQYWKLHYHSIGNYITTVLETTLP